MTRDEPTGDRNAEDGAEGRRSYDLGTLTWREVSEHLRRESRLILAVGALEQHGPHLPLGTNTIIAGSLAREISRELGILRAPTFPYGVALPGAAAFAGTASLRRKTLHRAINELIAAWEDHGVSEFVMITAHRYEPHLDALLMALTNTSTPTVIDVYAIDVSDLIEGAQEGEHGGEVETSLLLHLAPEHVRLDLLQDFVPNPETYRKYIRGRVPTPPPGSQGTVGRPSRATPTKGRRIFERYVQRIRDTLADRR